MPAGAGLATAWRRENLRVRLSSAPSIEETGLDAVLYGERQPFFTPRGDEPPSRGAGRGGETFHDALAAVHGEKDRNGEDGNGEEGIRLEPGHSTPLQAAGEYGPGPGRLKKQGSGFGGRMDSVGKKPSGESFAEVWQRLAASKTAQGAQAAQAPQAPSDEVAASPGVEGNEEKALPTLRGRLGTYRSNSVQRTSSAHLRLDRLSGIDEGDLAEESAATTPRNGDQHETPFAGSGTLPSSDGSTRLLRSSSVARNRWRRLRHTVQFAAHMTHLRYWDTITRNPYWVALISSRAFLSRAFLQLSRCWQYVPN